MKYFAITGIITHIAVILYLIFSFVIGDTNFINWEPNYRLNYILSLGLSCLFSSSLSSSSSDESSSSE